MPDLSHPLQHGSSEASIDQVNIWMRATPWYQQQMRAWGQDPGHPTLTKDQSRQILKLAQANGVQVNEGDVELDNHGNFNPKGHKLRNTLIVAGLAAATIATMGAAGAFSAAAAPGAAAASGTGAAAAGSVGAGTAAGLGAAALPGAMATLPAIGAGAATAGTTAAVSSAVVPAVAKAGIGASLMKFGGSTLGTTLASTFTDIYAANKQIGAANRSADLQLQSNREALAFQEREADRQRAADEATRRANYDQWAAQRRRLGTLGQMLGYAPPEIPDYVPLYPSDARAVGAGQTPAAAAASSSDLSGAQAKFNALFPGETLTPDMVKAKEAELKAAGFTLRPNAAGQVGKIQYGTGPIIDIIQGASSGVNKKQWLLPTAAAPARLGTLGQIAGYQRSTPTTAVAQGLVLPTLQTRPRTLYDYAGAY